ncbi:Zn-ribbon domain-containing OB-fold protein [Candidimonas humi]|uniref:Zn-ribbon domain-containing OB-fold protein n=1 Tax=Candidimonas humi TaxID=683355 RepID=A0ABV8NWN8_9BURK
MTYYLPKGLPAPVAELDGVSAQFWSGLCEEKLYVQRCARCGTWQFGPECICHNCHEFDPPWVEVTAAGVIYSWERIWHPVHPALKARCPYIAVLVELPHAGNIRLVGNLLGDPMQAVAIGAHVSGRYEHHGDAQVPYTLLQWQLD